MLRAINNARVINKKTRKMRKFCVLQVIFFSLKLVGIAFIFSSYDYLTSSHIITESTIILPKDFPFLLLHAEGFQK